MQRAGESYDRLAWFYEAAAHLYSGGQIQALKTHQIEAMQRGDKVLYAGVGGGEDAVLATKRHVALTVLDTSSLMLEQAARKFHDAGVADAIEIVCSDVLKHNRSAYYDIVVVNFFLNIFSEPAMKAVLAHMATLLKPGGKILIGDFSYPRGHSATQSIQRLYYFLSMFSFWLAGGTTLHPIYDYPQYFDAVELRSLSVKRFRVSALFPASFESITAVKM